MTITYGHDNCAVLQYCLRNYVNINYLNEIQLNFQIFYELVEY